LKKKQEKKKPGVTWQVDPVKTRLQPIDFCLFFLLKRHRFDFLKKKELTR
jgi:hypothetical protein